MMLCDCVLFSACNFTHPQEAFLVCHEKALIVCMQDDQICHAFKMVLVGHMNDADGSLAHTKRPETDS